MNYFSQKSKKISFEKKLKYNKNLNILFSINKYAIFSIILYFRKRLEMIIDHVRYYKYTQY